LIMLQPTIAQAAAFLVTLVSCLALALTTRWHGRLTLDSTVGLQKFHSTPTPRVGGLATLAGLVAGHSLAPEPVRQLLGPLLLASLPAYCSGLLEDLTKKVGVRERLLGTCMSGVLAWYLTGVTLTRTGVPGLDDLLSYAPVAIVFTAVAIGGVANAVNIVDGFNGLAGGVLSVMFIALGVIAAGQGDEPLARTCWILAACALGFTCINWPFGKIFLGDGGAYQLGFALGWVAVLLVMRHPTVPAWAPLTVCAYPILEVAFSIVRKTRRAGYSPGQPDRVHLHMLVHRRVVRQWLPSLSQVWQNGLTSPFAWAYCGMLATWGGVFAQQTPYLIAGLLGAALIYARIYIRLTHFRWWPAGVGAAHPHRAQPSSPEGNQLHANAPPAFLPVPLARQAIGPVVDLNHPIGDGVTFMAVTQAVPRAEDPARSTVALYAIMGLSTCIALVEPAPFEVIALPLALASWIRHVLARSRSYTPFSASLVLLLALFLVMQLLPALGTALEVPQAIEYAAVTSILIVIAIHLGRLFGSGDARFSAFVYGYCIAALISAVVAIGSLYFGDTGRAPEWLFLAGRPKAFFKDPNVLGPYLIPAVLAFLYRGGQLRSFRKVAYVAYALICALGVIATMSRGAWINLAIAVAVYTFMARSKAQILVAASWIACLMVALVAGMNTISASAPDLAELFGERTQLRDYDAERFEKSREAWEVGLRHPVGVGPGNITNYTGLEGMAPHNTYARIWAENGPAALILFLAIVCAAWASALQAWFRSRRRESGAAAVVLALLIGVLVNVSVVDAIHWRHFWVILCVCLFSSGAWRKSGAL
jgi:UDP-N-acetylmuramyl pentapeptide phosphotransferase/UDP-N-acetylglucosamine-1-phosphate transferase/O-antigen ligase